MRILVTAGNTATPVDAVRVITNVFRGRTGARIAAELARRGHHVRLLTSGAATLADDLGVAPTDLPGLEICHYTFFDDLHDLMQSALSEQHRRDPAVRFDVLIHSAAVSDFAVVGRFVPAEPAKFADGRWSPSIGPHLQSLPDRPDGKLRSHHNELWLQLRPTPKLIDLVRPVWGFAGTVVKFKLEVGVTVEELLTIAEHSRRYSQADLMVANRLDDVTRSAWIGPQHLGGYCEVAREHLPAALANTIETRLKPADGANGQPSLGIGRQC